MSKLAVIADVHAQRSAWANRPIEGDSAFALHQFAQICLDDEVDFALGLGDLKERPLTKPYDDGLWLRTLALLEEGGIPFLYIQGNHDKADPPCLWEYPNAIHVNGLTTTLTGGETVYGIDYQDADSLRAALDAVPAGTDFLAVHQRWDEYMGSATNPQGKLADIHQPGLKLVLSGDLHQTIIEDVASVGGTFAFVSPGSPTMQSIVEDAEKCVIIVEHGVPRVVPLKSRQVIRSPMLAGPAELSEFLAVLPGLLADARERAAAAELPDALHTPILQVRYSHRLDDCVRRVGRLAAEKAHLFWKEQPPDAAETGAKVSVVTRGEAVTPLGVLPLVVSREEEPLVFALLERGLTSRDKDEMARKTQEFCDAFLEGRDVDQGSPG